MASTDPIVAAFVDATTFTATVDALGVSDLRGQCAVGVKIKANCGADGYKYGVVSSVSYSAPTTTIKIVGDALTSNLVNFFHSNDTPDSLVHHRHSGPADGGIASGVDAGDLVSVSGLGTMAFVDQTWLYASPSVDLAGISAGGKLYFDATVPGADVGDFVLVSLDYGNTFEAEVWGIVNSANTVRVMVRNNSASPMDLPSRPYNIAVLKRRAVR